MKTKTKRLVVFSSFALCAIALTTTVVIASGSNFAGPLGDQYNAVEGSTYSLTIDGNLGLAGKSSATATTTSGGSVTFSAAGLSVNGTNLGDLIKSSGGLIKNETAITGLKSVTINFSSVASLGAKVSFGVKNNGTIDYIVSKTTNDNTEIKVSDLTTYDISFVKIEVEDGDANIVNLASIVFSYTCTKVTTNYQKVDFQVEGTTAKTSYVENGSTIPSFTPTMDGYTFHEWVDADGASLTDKAISAPTTATASWYRNVEESVSGSVQKDFLTYDKPWENGFSLSAGASWDGVNSEYLLIGAKTAKTTYSVTFPGIDFASAVASGGEVSFDLSTDQGWEYFNVAGGDIYYQDEHKPSDPYRISIRSNGVGLSVYATSSTYSNFGEIAVLSTEVANGTAGLSITFHSNEANRQVRVSKFSIYTFDYGAAITNALSVFNESPSKETYLAYQTMVAQNLTPYEETHYTEPQAITTAKTTYASETYSPLTLSAQSGYFSDTDAMRKASGDLGLYHNGFNATGVTYDPYAWEFQFAAGKTSAYLEFPKTVYTNYSSTLFKMWRGGENGAFSVNGTKIQDATDCPNGDWAYWVEITTADYTSTLKVYHGGADKTKGDLMNTMVLPSDVASGRVPLNLVCTPSAAFTATATWGITSFASTI